MTFEIFMYAQLLKHQRIKYVSHARYIVHSSQALLPLVSLFAYALDLVTSRGTRPLDLHPCVKQK